MTETYGAKSAEQRQVDTWFGEFANQVRNTAEPLWNLTSRDTMTLDEYIYLTAPEAFEYNASGSHQEHAEDYVNLIRSREDEERATQLKKMESSLVVAVKYLLEIDNMGDRQSAMGNINVYASEHLITDEQQRLIIDKARLGE